METQEAARPRGSIRRWRRLAGLGLLSSSVACFPGDGPSSVQDLDVVITVRDQHVDFSNFRTFAMPDTVLHVIPDQRDNLLGPPRTYDGLILRLAAANMAAAGYSRELHPETNGADLILLVEAVGSKSEVWIPHDWWSWWGWYPGWGYPGYPEFGPGWGWSFPPYAGTVTCEAGSIVLTLVDPTRINGESIPVVWSGLARGIQEGGEAAGGITHAINQMFSQSRYLSR